jgi:hypothetical protein
MDAIFKNKNYRLDTIKFQRKLLSLYPEGSPIRKKIQANAKLCELENLTSLLGPKEFQDTVLNLNKSYQKLYTICSVVAFLSSVLLFGLSTNINSHNTHLIFLGLGSLAFTLCIVFGTRCYSYFDVIRKYEKARQIILTEIRNLMK